MAFKVKNHNAFEKGIRSIDSSNRKVVLDECDKIQADPSIGETTKGNLKKLDVKKYSVKETNPQYRILYKVNKCNKKGLGKSLVCNAGAQHQDEADLNDCEGFIDFIICGTREMFNNFYKLPLDKLKQYL